METAASRLTVCEHLSSPVRGFMFNVQADNPSADALNSPCTEQTLPSVYSSFAQCCILFIISLLSRTLPRTYRLDKQSRINFTTISGIVERYESNKYVQHRAIL